MGDEVLADISDPSFSGFIVWFGQIQTGGQGRGVVLHIMKE